MSWAQLWENPGQTLVDGRVDWTVLGMPMNPQTRCRKNGLTALGVPPTVFRRQNFHHARALLEALPTPNKAVRVQFS
ncbi:hypothetical protein CDV36_014973 [Fusarium kuroshium]|uniref:Uncharacterized protein n=1 Tax=Fusarium kuroshium TaxID=2010991 RepID=A0A3M2RDW0_9HYPO|nr:hypothetical protein CDV36_014973 [Fusarium kuroshium]